MLICNALSLYRNKIPRIIMGNYVYADLRCLRIAWKENSENSASVDL